jgi:hypothetical protein
MGKVRNANKISVVETKWKRPLGGERIILKWLLEKLCVMIWARFMWLRTWAIGWALVDMAINLLSRIRDREFFTRQVTIGFSKRTLPYGVSLRTIFIRYLTIILFWHNNPWRYSSDEPWAG